MSKLQYRTIADERPQGKPKVYFACHPDDFGVYFEEYAAKIHMIQDCAIWYESEPEADYDRDDLELNLSQMQLFVIPVTTKLLTTPNRAMDLEFQLAKERHIPVLPIMMERGLVDVYSKRFGKLQYMDPNNTDETRRSFDEVLETYIKSILVSNELAGKIRAAFDAYIFLSYRKKDRRKAQELMRLIHRSPLCRDIAIWYDEFLIPGEDFNEAIGKMLQKSDLFALVVTPNLVNETNYVMTTEYPAAMNQGKLILPVEMEETDRGQLEAHYKSIPPCVPGEESEAFRKVLLEKIRTMAVETSEKDPEHNFMIGLAYLDGIDVEVDAERALGLIKGAAEAEVPEAMEQLVTMYENGKGVARDYYEGVRWREKHVEYLRKVYKEEPTGDNATGLLKGLWDFGKAQSDLAMYEKARQVYGEMNILAEQWAGSGEYTYLRYLSVSYGTLGDAARAMGDLPAAKDYYEKGLAISDKLVEKTGAITPRRDLSMSYSRLGSIAGEMRDLYAAKKYYEKCLTISEELWEKVGTIKSRRDLANDYNSLGHVAREMGDLPAAKDYYEKSLAIREELWEKTGTIESRINLSISNRNLGFIARIMGDLPAAKDYFEKSLAIREGLWEKTGTIRSRRDLSDSYRDLGDTAREMGDLSAAKGYYEKSLAIREELWEKTGTNKSKRDLSVSYNTLGDALRAMKDLSAAKGYYEKCFAIREELLKKVGTMESSQDLSSVIEKLGHTARAMGDLPTAKGYYEKCLAIKKKLCEKTRTYRSKRDLSITYDNLGNTARAMGDLYAAKEFYEKGLSIDEELAEKSGMIESKRDLSISYNNLGNTMREMKDLPAAMNYYKKCLAVSKELAEKTGTIKAMRDLADIYNRLGYTAREMGDVPASKDYYERYYAVVSRLKETR